MTTENLIPFDLEAFKGGAKARTRAGEEAVFDSMNEGDELTHCVYAHVNNQFKSFTKAGVYCHGVESENDLFMVEAPPVAEVEARAEVSLVAGEAVLGFAQSSSFAEGAAKIIVAGMSEYRSADDIRPYLNLYKEFAG